MLKISSNLAAILFLIPEQKVPYTGNFVINNGH